MNGGHPWRLSQKEIHTGKKHRHKKLSYLSAGLFFFHQSPIKRNVNFTSLASSFPVASHRHNYSHVEWEWKNSWTWGVHWLGHWVILEPDFTYHSPYTVTSKALDWHWWFCLEILNSSYISHPLHQAYGCFSRQQCIRLYAASKR